VRPQGACGKGQGANATQRVSIVIRWTVKGGRKVMKKIYCEIDISGSCHTICTICQYKYNGTSPYYHHVTVGSASCKDCNNYITQGIDDGGDYVLCNNN
jgi:hypothetical protein